MSDPPGLVAGRFRLGELLGTGGSASVFAAVDHGTGASVALKILHPHLAERPTARDAFLAEAERALPLRHPNIVGVIDVGVTDEVAWIALERVDGVTLAELVSREGPLAAADAATVGGSVLRALEEAHAAGIVHRDVSPSNVMVAPRAAGAPLDPRGIRLLDFGLADAAGTAALGTDDLLSARATGRAGVLGNVNYISPEQARGNAVEARGDVYQAGALLYFALTARPPFPRATAEQTLRAHLDAPPPVPSVAAPRVPRALDRIVVRAMLKEPSDRFASAAEMRAALAHAGLSIADARGSDPSARDASAAAGVAASAALSPTDTADVTRVVGSTVVPPRVAPSGEDAPDPAVIGRVRPRVPVWLLGAAAVVLAVVVASTLASRAPSVSVGDGPSRSPRPPAATPTATPAPEPATQGVQPARLIPVLDLTGYTLGEAVQALADAGLAAGSITRVDSAQPADTVLESRPIAGHGVAAGTEIEIVIASGFHGVPDVAGQSRDAATALVYAAGFAPSFEYRGAPAGAPAGSALGTDPPAGTRYAVGAVLTIFEALPPTPTVTPQPTPTAPGATPTPSPEE